MNPEASIETKNLTYDVPGTEHDQQNEQERWLEGLARELAENDKIVDLFGLDAETIINEIRGFSIQEGREISPQFKSPGYKHSTPEPVIVRSRFGIDEHTALLHELKHGLHYALGKRYFEGSDGGDLMERYRLFAGAVLGDYEFMRHMEKEDPMLRNAWIAHLLENPPTNPQEVASIARELGGLVFQHAYFVDPALCEAVGSFEDRGVMTFLNGYNRAAGYQLPEGLNKALHIRIPHHGMFEGYGNIKLQEYFSELPIEGKLVLVRKEEYVREVRPVSSAIH